MERAISTLTQLPTTQSQIYEYVCQLKSDIISGWISAEESALILKSFEYVVKKLKDDKDVKEYLYTELEKYTEKTIDYKGCQITKSERTTYDYSSDEEYSELKEQEKDLKAYIKAREQILKRNRDKFPSKTTSFLTIKLAK